MAIMMILLLALCVPVIVFVAHTGSRHEIHAEKEEKARAVAEEGIAYASKMLSQNANVWQAALNDKFHIDPALADCLTSENGVNVSGTNFRLLCSRDTSQFPGLLSYQVAVVSTAWMPDNRDDKGNIIPSKAVQVYLGQSTMGVTLASGMHASAALELVKVPNIGANYDLHVFWGPIVCLDTANWRLKGVLDSFSPKAGTVIPGYPRKFSNGLIQSAPGSPIKRDNLTDQKEYWSNADMRFPPQVNGNDYANNAMHEPVGPPPWFPDPQCSPTPCTRIGGGYFEVPAGEEAVFDGPAVAYPGSSGTKPVLYVKGNALFNNLHLDVLKDGGAVIITGNLRLGSSPGPGIPPTPPNPGPNPIIRLPPPAPAEYPYWPPPPFSPQWLCYNNFANCKPYPIHFHGFLWVMGDLTVQGDWYLNGVVLVGDLTKSPSSGTLNVTGGNLHILYDDEVNHNINVAPSTSGTTL